MARGAYVENGATRVAQNGYHYIKVDGKWRLRHHIEAEKKLGRPLRQDERVSFKDKNKSNFALDNLVIAEKGTGSVRRRKAQIEARIAELQAELHEIEEELRGGRITHRS